MHIEIDQEEYIFFLNQAISLCIAGGLGKTTVATVGSVLLWKSNNTQCRQREVVNFPAICMDLFKRLFPPGRWTQEDLVSAHRANMNMYYYSTNAIPPFYGTFMLR